MLLTGSNLEIKPPQGKPKMILAPCSGASASSRACTGSGPRLFNHFLNEVERGAPVWPHVERYAALPADFIKVSGGDRFAPSLHCIDGGKP